jgi:hypothetical protein
MRFIIVVHARTVVTDPVIVDGAVDVAASAAEVESVVTFVVVDEVAVVDRGVVAETKDFLHEKIQVTSPFSLP